MTSEITLSLLGEKENLSIQLLLQKTSQFHLVMPLDTYSLSALFKNFSFRLEGHLGGPKGLAKQVGTFVVQFTLSFGHLLD